MKLIYTIIIAISISITCTSQRIQSIPSAFANPKYHETPGEMARYIAEGLQTNVLRQEWIVFSDRVDNVSYTKPSLQSEEKTTLEYLQYYYVIDREGSWLHLAGGMPQNKKVLAGFKDYGWVRCDSKTRLIAKVYDHPESDFDIDNINLYNYFFILKEEKNRYLLSKELIINRTLSSEDIVGWVDKDKIHLWRTRLALEPNFDELAYAERKSDPNLKIKAFRTKEDAALSYNGGAPKPVMQNDPVDLPSYKLANSNPRRHKGMVLRYPVIDKTKEVFHSAAVGEVQTQVIDEGLNKLLLNEEDFIGPISSEHAYASIHSITNKTRSKRDNINIFLLLENSETVYSYKENIAELIKDIEYDMLETTINIGVGIYDDFNIEDEKAFSFKELSTDKRATITYFNNWKPNQKAASEDSWTNLYYAMDKSCQNAGFAENSSNILIVVAENRDFTHDKPRLLLLDEKSSQYNVTEPQLAEKLSKFEMNTFFIQPSISFNQSVKKLTSDMRSIMINSATNSFKDYSKIKDEFKHFNVPNPSMPILDQSGEINLRNGIVQSALLYPSAVSMTLPAHQIVKFIKTNVLNVHKVAEQTHKKIISIIGDGDGLVFSEMTNVSSGQWDPIVANIIMEYMESNPEIDRVDIKKVINEQIKLFHEVYFPSQYGTTGNHPAFKYVAFMPQKDLIEYINTIKRLDEASTKSIDKQREALFSNIVELIKKLTGDNLTNLEIKSKKIGYLDYLLQGIEDQGYDIKSELDFKIGDIYNLNREELQRIYMNFSESLIKLNKIKGEGLKHEFSYNAGKLSPEARVFEENTYFWIPLDFLLISK